MADKVTLTHPIIGEREFDQEHAERLLAMVPNGGWVKITNNSSDDVDSTGDQKKAARRVKKSDPDK